MAGAPATIQRREKVAGLILVASALVALIVANGPAASAYSCWLG